MPPGICWCVAAAASMRAASRQLGQSPDSVRHVAQTFFPQPVQRATDGTA
jgi:hypothetical protein